VDYDFDKELRGDELMSNDVVRAADTAAAISLPVWLVSFLADAWPIVQFTGGILAIVASVFAIVVHIRKLRE